jgi:hypothetical protein
MESSIKIGGQLSVRLIRTEWVGLGWKLRNLPNVWRGWWKYQIAKILGIPTLYGQLWLRLRRADGSIVDYGLVSTRVVTTAFVNFVVDQLQTETSVFGDFKYHDSGVGTTAAAVGDTDIETTDGESRATGSQTEGASANVYKSVGTISYTSNLAITEHGLFNDATAGTLMDRHVFSAVNVENGNAIEFTYQLTVTAGG